MRGLRIIGLLNNSILSPFMLALCVFGSDSAGAAPVGREKAAAAAEAFWNSVPETKSSCAVLKFVDDSRAAAAGIPAYYIFENVAAAGS